MMYQLLHNYTDALKRCLGIQICILKEFLIEIVVWLANLHFEYYILDLYS